MFRVRPGVGGRIQMRPIQLFEPRPSELAGSQQLRAGAEHCGEVRIDRPGITHHVAVGRADAAQSVNGGIQQLCHQAVEIVARRPELLGQFHDVPQDGEDMNHEVGIQLADEARPLRAQERERPS